MHPEGDKGEARAALLPADSTFISEGEEGLMLAVVTNASWSGVSTGLDLTSVDCVGWWAVVKNKAEFLHGKLVVVNNSCRYIAPFDRPDLLFTLLSLTKLD
jgi:hypothetical protein